MNVFCAHVICLQTFDLHVEHLIKYDCNLMRSDIDCKSPWTKSALPCIWKQGEALCNAEIKLSKHPVLLVSMNNEYFASDSSPFCAYYVHLLYKKDM